MESSLGGEGGIVVVKGSNNQTWNKEVHYTMPAAKNTGKTKVASVANTAKIKIPVNRGNWYKGKQLNAENIYNETFLTLKRVQRTLLCFVHSTSFDKHGPVLFRFSLFYTHRHTDTHIHGPVGMCVGNRSHVCHTRTRVHTTQQNVGGSWSNNIAKPIFAAS